MIEAITSSTTFKKMDEAMAKQVQNINPDILLYLLYSIIVLCLLYGIVRIWKLFWAPGSEMIQQYKGNYEQANVDSMQKSLILTLFDQVNREISHLLLLHEESSDKIVQQGRKLTDMIIEQIPLCLKSMKNINHRCAVFVKETGNPSKLKILEGCGFSLQGKENLRLDISGSLAGKVFTQGEYVYCKDVSKEPGFKPHPKATKQYFSLLCVPIKIDGHTVAVLSIDGSEKDCFSADDIGYFQMFSNQLAIIFDLTGITDDEGGNENGEEIQNIG